MKIQICDKCGKTVKHPNKIHVYNYTVKKYAPARKINRPKRNDFDLCDKCRLLLLKWILNN